MASWLIMWMSAVIDDTDKVRSIKFIGFTPLAPVVSVRRQCCARLGAELDPPPRVVTRVPQLGVIVQVHIGGHILPGHPGAVTRVLTCDGGAALGPSVGITKLSIILALDSCIGGCL